MDAAAAGDDEQWSGFTLRNRTRGVAASAPATVTDCALTGNSDGGASGGTRYHGIVYFNQDSNWADATFEHSCTTPLPPGSGNIGTDPGFLNTAAGDFRLHYGSPCIKAVDA